MVDLGRREPGDLYRSVQQDQFLKLNLQGVEIPLPLFCQAIDRQSEYALFVWIQMLDADARDSIEAQLLGCRVARFAVNELVAASDQERVAETEEANRGSDFSHVSGIELAQLPGGGPKLFERNVGKLQAREACRCVVYAPQIRGPSAPGLRVGCGSSASVGRRELRGMQSD